MRGPKEEEEEAKCRECVEHLNALSPSDPPRYSYMGLVRELTGKDFPDCQIKDRETGTEIGVELTRLALDWVPAEKKNMEILERRLGYELKGRGFEAYRINLQTRDYTNHPLAVLDTAALDDIARVGRRFFNDYHDALVERINVPIFLDAYRERYPRFLDIFQVVILSLLPSGFESRVDDQSPVVSIGVIAWEHSELDAKVAAALSGKLRGPAYSTDLLLIHGEPSAVGLDSHTIVEKLKMTAVAEGAEKNFKQIWYLSPYWQDGKKLHRVV